MYVLINQIVVINIKIMMTTSKEEGEGERLEQLVTLTMSCTFKEPLSL